MIRDFVRSKINKQADPEVVGINQFNLFARVSDNISYASQVPVHYLEDGSFASDHVINEPIKISISGIVADEYIELGEPNELLQGIENLAGRIGVYFPVRTQSTMNKIYKMRSEAFDAIDKIDETIDLFNTGFGLFAGNTEKSIREKFVEWLDATWTSKQPVKVQMRFKNYDNMLITSVDVRTDNKTEEIQFEINLQQARLSKSISVDITDFFGAAPAARDSVADVVDKGSQSADSGKERSLLAAGIRGLGF